MIYRMKRKIIISPPPHKKKKLFVRYCGEILWRWTAQMAI
jgi:hypothetical protein